MCARHHPQMFTCIIIFNFQNSLMRWRLLSTFCTQGNKATEKFSHTTNESNSLKSKFESNSLISESVCLYYTYTSILPGMFSWLCFPLLISASSVFKPSFLSLIHADQSFLSFFPVWLHLLVLVIVYRCVSDLLNLIYIKIVHNNT